MGVHPTVEPAAAFDVTAAAGRVVRTVLVVSVLVETRTFSSGVVYLRHRVLR